MDNLLFTWFAFTVCFCAVLLAVGLISTKKGPFYLLALSYFLWIVLIPGWFQSHEGYFYWCQSDIDRELQIGALVQIILFLAFLEIAYDVYAWQKRSVRTTTQQHIYDISYQAVLCGSVLALVISGFAVAKLGINTFLGTRASVTESAGGSAVVSGLLLSLPRAISIVQIAITFLYIRQHRRQPWLRSLMLAGPALASAIVLWPTALPRFVLLGAVLSILYIACLEKRWTLRIGTAVCFPIGLFTVVPLLSTYNRSENVASLDLRSLPSGSEILSHGDYDSFEWIAHTRDYVDESGICYGANLLSAIGFMVPRSVAPAKLPHTGSIVAAATGLKYPNVSCPVPAEGYFSFGAIGSILVACFLGATFAHLDLSYGRTSAIPLNACAACLFGQLTILLRGSLLAVINVFASQVFWIVTVVAISLLIRFIATSTRKNVALVKLPHSIP